MTQPSPSMPLLEVTVETGKLRRALIAVVVHAAKDSDVAHLHRIRCYIAPDLLTVTATDGYTGAAARVPVIAASDLALANVGFLDLAPSDIAKILAVFRVGKRKDGDDLEMLIRIQIIIRQQPVEPAGDTDDTDDAAGTDEQDQTAYYVHLTDVSGLIDGETLELPMLTADPHAPHVPSMLAANIAARPGVLDAVGISAEMIARFAIAAKTYKRELLMTAAETTRTSVVVRCGQTFIGLAAPLRFPEDEEAKHREWLEAWTALLPPKPQDVEDPE